MPLPLLPALLLLAPPLLAAEPSAVAQMKWERRVLIVAAPSTQDPAIAEQKRILDAWREKDGRSGGEDRDLAVVAVIGGTVAGATDDAAALRKTYRLPANRFEAILIGKDGGEKLRSARPFPAATLRDTIDAMPMRKGEQH